MTSKKIKILISGDRNWQDMNPILEKLKDFIFWDVTIIEGGARGVDLLSKKASFKLGFKVIEVKAEWDKYGRGAGIIRNIKMLDIV